MKTISTTRWIDEKTTDIDEVARLFLSTHPDEHPEVGPGYSNWQITKLFPDNKKDIFNGREIEYNFYTYSVDKTSAGMMADEDMNVKKTGFVIPYYSNGRIRYIINRNTDALNILRKMLFYTGKNEITKNPVKVSGDLFVWLISKVYNCENIFESDNEELENISIDSIKGFKGNTEDLLTKVSASGETVMNIISSLSFLIESQNLNQVTLDIAYRGHLNIEVALNNRNTIATSLDKYIGELIQYRTEEIYSKLFLLLYIEILPIIIQNYESEIGDGRWGSGKCVEFLQTVANDLSEKVKLRIEDLASRPEQLTFM